MRARVREEVWLSWDRCRKHYSTVGHTSYRGNLPHDIFGLRRHIDSHFLDATLCLVKRRDLPPFTLKRGRASGSPTDGHLPVVRTACILSRRHSQHGDGLHNMVTAYADTLLVLGLPNVDAPLNRVVARKVIEIAQTGELDPARLSTRAISALGIPNAA